MHVLKRLFTHLMLPLLVLSGPLAPANFQLIAPPLSPQPPRYSIPSFNGSVSDPARFGYACMEHDPITVFLEQQICFEAWRRWLSSHMAKTYILTRDPSHIPPNPAQDAKWVVVPSDSDVGECRVRVNMWPPEPQSAADRSISQYKMMEGMNDVWMHCFTKGEEGEVWDGGFVIFDNEGRGQVVVSVLHKTYQEQPELDAAAVEKLFSDAKNGTVNTTAAGGGPE